MDIMDYLEDGIERAKELMDQFTKELGTTAKLIEEDNNGKANDTG